MLDRELQNRILTSLSEAYPNECEVSSFLDATNNKDQANLFYLEEHGLIESCAVSNGLNSSKQMLSAQITAHGLDFLEDDGGLGAILNVLTVKIDSANIKEILEAKILSSDLVPEDKESAINKVKSFTGDVMKNLIIKLIEKGVDNPEKIGKIIETISKMG